MKIEIEKRKKRGKAMGFYLDDELLEKFSKKVKEVGSDKTKVVRALIKAWVEEDEAWLLPRKKL